MRINRPQKPVILYNYKTINAAPNSLGWIPLII